MQPSTSSVKKLFPTQRRRFNGKTDPPVMRVAMLLPLWPIVETDPHPSGWDTALFVALLFILAVGLVWAVLWLG